MAGFAVRLRSHGAMQPLPRVSSASLCGSSSTLLLGKMALSPPIITTILWRGSGTFPAGRSLVSGATQYAALALANAAAIADAASNPPFGFPSDASRYSVQGYVFGRDDGEDCLAVIPPRIICSPDPSIPIAPGAFFNIDLSMFLVNSFTYLLTTPTGPANMLSETVSGDINVVEYELTRNVALNLRLATGEEYSLDITASNAAGTTVERCVWSTTVVTTDSDWSALVNFPREATTDSDWSALTQFTLNSPPVCDPLPDRTVVNGQSANVDVSAFLSDPDGDSITIEATETSSRISISNLNASAHSFTINGLSVGTATVTVTPIDELGLRGTACDVHGDSAGGRSRMTASLYRRSLLGHPGFANGLVIPSWPPAN